MTSQLMTTNGGAGRRFLRAKIQASEGTPETLADTDLLTVVEGSLTPEHTPVRLSVVAPEQAGTLGVSTQGHMTVTLKSRIQGRTITSANDADAPEGDKILRCGGYTRISESSPSKTHTYFLTSNQSEVLTIDETRINANNTDYLRLGAAEVRGSAVISANVNTDGGVVYIDLQGLGPYGDPSTATEPIEKAGNAWSGTLVYDKNQPFILQGSTVQIYDPASGTLYGGGSLASPGTDGQLLAFVLDPKRAPAARTTASASGGIVGAVAGIEGASLSLSVEGLADDHLALQSLKASGSPLFFRVVIPQRGTSNTMTLLTWAYIEGLNQSEAAQNRYVYQMAMNCVWPPDAADNNPTAGSSPTQLIKAATNYGIPVLPGGTLPPAIAWIQFRTP